MGMMARYAAASAAVEVVRAARNTGASVSEMFHSDCSPATAGRGCRNCSQSVLPGYVMLYSPNHSWFDRPSSPKPGMSCPHRDWKLTLSL